MVAVRDDEHEHEHEGGGSCRPWALWDAVSVSYVGLLAYPFVRLAATMNPVYAVMGVGAVAADLVTKCAKKVAVRTVGPGAPLPGALARPPGARDCDIFCRNGSCAGAPGFPSGHAAVAAFVLASILQVDVAPGRMPLACALAAAALALIGYSRTAKLCHTPAQVLAGAATGAALSLAALLPLRRMAWMDGL